MKQVNIGIIGLGTIGKGVYDAIKSNGQLIARRTGISLVVKGVCDTNAKVLSGISGKGCSIKTKDFKDLTNCEDIDIIVELIGGINPAKTIVLGALAAKKHVVTANKALLSEHWKEIFAESFRNERFINFEASVGGAIPIIRTLRTSFVADKISTIFGILNGTTNFILTEMAERGCVFKDALKLAQEKGIAEKDPSLDITGKDSAHKLAILSLLGFGIDISTNDVYTEGITNIGPVDIQNANALGFSVKLLAIAKRSSSGLELRVHPTLIRSRHILSDVKGENNAVFIKGDLIGESLLFGKGAGSKPTSSSVIGDIVEIAKHIVFVNNNKSIPYFSNYAVQAESLSPMEDLIIPYYLRFSVIDKSGVLAGISSVLAKNDISIASVSQRERNEGEAVPVVILTHKAREGNMRKAISAIDALGYVTSKSVVIRIEE